MRAVTALGIGLALMLAGCERDLDGPRQYFARGKIGNAPDYGIVKFHEPENMIGVIYGNYDSDADVCEYVASALNVQACEETGGEGCLNPYSCVPLNDAD